MMKKFAFLALSLGMSLSPIQASLVLEWGTSVQSDFFDSHGNNLDASYTWELGVFKSGFVPTEANVELWATNWVVFDQATFVPYDVGDPYSAYFYGTDGVTMYNDGSSSSSYADPAFDFQGLNAYIWGYNKKDYEYGLEWVVFRANNKDSEDEPWTFPVFDQEDPPELNWKWSTSDLVYDTAVDTPLWGNQNGVIGLGYASNPQYSSPDMLQTYTLIPEPGSVAVGVLLVGAIGAHQWRKRRAKKSDISEA